MTALTLLVLSDNEKPVFVLERQTVLIYPPNTGFERIDFYAMCYQHIQIMIDLFS